MSVESDKNDVCYKPTIRLKDKYNFQLSINKSCSLYAQRNTC